MQNGTHIHFFCILKLQHDNGVAFFFLMHYTTKTLRTRKLMTVALWKLQSRWTKRIHKQNLYLAEGKTKKELNLYLRMLVNSKNLASEVEDRK